MKNSIEDLRGHLFETIERLKDPEEDDKMDVETAKAINSVAQTIINSAKEETRYFHLTGQKPSTSFMPAPDPEPGTIKIEHQSETLKLKENKGA